jgi:hypothetical protein
MKVPCYHKRDAEQSEALCQCWSAVSLALRYFIGSLFHGMIFPTSDGLWECFDVARVRNTGTTI